MVSRLARVLPLVAYGVVACGDDTPSTTEGPDTAAPRLVTTIPSANSTSALPGTDIVLVFSEPMDTSAGTVDINPRLQIASSVWTMDTVYTLRGPTEAGVSYRVSLRGFRDKAGNPLSEEIVVFTVASFPDLTAPLLVATMPADGADDAPATLSSLRFTFSEPMDTTAGTLAVASGSATLGTPTWSTPSVLSVPVSGLVAGQVYAFRPMGFRDTAGNAVDASIVLPDGTLDFTVRLEEDRTPPVATMSMPLEGAPTVNPTLRMVTLTFNEPMDATRSAATLNNGTNTVTLMGTWNAEQTTITYPVTLVGGRTYVLTPTSYRDLAGNALDGAAYLGNGSLDFTTEVLPDRQPPAVASVSPSDMATDVPTGLAEIVVTFDEPMTPMPTQVQLANNLQARTATLTGVWSMGNRTFTLAVSGLVVGRTYSIDLRAFRDVAGNALQQGPNLGDGILQFSTPPDMVGPQVIAATPAEGAADVTPAQASVVITFSEPVAANSVMANLADGMMTTPLMGQLDPSATQLTYSVAGLIRPNTTYRINLTGVRDLSNNALQPTPFLGDGILDFISPPPPTGFACSSALTAPYGARTANGVRFVVPAAAAGRDGSFSCDSNGPGDDIVIAYEKQSGTVAQGGRLLSVGAVSASSQALNVEVLNGACTTGSATREKCFWNKQNLDVLLDVPAGRYWIWISSENGGMGQTFPGATVAVEEIPPTLAEGEGCWRPYSATSSSFTAPTVPGDPGTWRIPANAINSFDMDVTWGGSGSISCDSPDSQDIHGVDAVFEIRPTRTNAIIQVTAQAQGAMSAPINMEILDRCNSRSPSRRSLGCSANDRFHELVTTSTSPIYVWVAPESPSADWPGVDVTYREIIPATGESCATGRLIPAPGPVTLANTSNQRLQVPRCLETAGNVEWFRYTVQNGIVQITAQNQLEIGVQQATGAPNDRCSPDISNLGYGARFPVGTVLCISVPTAFGAPTFTLSDQPDFYSGVGTTTTAVAVAPATSWNADYWMAASRQWIYFGRDAGDVQRFSKDVLNATTAVSATTVFSGAGNVGRAAWALNDERLFSLDDGSSGSRVFRLWDGSSASFSAATWDLTPSYPLGEDLRALSFDDSTLLYATHRATGVDVYTLPASMAQSPSRLGTTSSLRNVVGIAADATFVYFAGVSAAGREGIFRIDRGDLQSPAQNAPATLLQALDLDLQENHAIYLDDPVNPRYLYVKSANPPAIWVIQDPGSAAPVQRGRLVTQGRGVDFAWTFDRSTNQIFFFESASSTNGRIIRVR